jgi:hypothetical protein
MMFGWFKKQHNRKAVAGKGVSKKEMRAGSKVGPNPMAEKESEVPLPGLSDAQSQHVRKGYPL